jgi:uncharacterized membrane protein (UPF0136 family)
MDKIATYSLLVYGLLLIVGGLIGFLKAGSRASLISGGSCGVIALVLFTLSLFKWPHAGISSIILAVMVLIMMSRRAVTKGLTGPSGFVFFLSLLIIAIQIVSLGKN